MRTNHRDVLIAELQRNSKEETTTGAAATETTTMVAVAETDGKKIRRALTFLKQLTDTICQLLLMMEGYDMIVTTTPSVEGRRIVEYKGIVFGEVISGVDFIKDFAAGLTNFFGGRSGSYEGELIAARDNAMMEMINRAEQYGANAIVGVDVDYEVLGQGNNMLMVTVSGTAVVLE